MPAVPSQATPTVGELIASVAASLKRARLFFGHGTATARDEAAALIYHVMGLAHDQAHAYDLRVPADAAGIIRSLLEQRIATRRPLAYVIGEAWFAGLPFFVDERVLIPRSPFAELLTGALFTWIEPEAVRTVLEIGTGSGCIAVAAARAFPAATVLATDVSGAALEVAARNVARHGLGGRIELREADIYAGIDGRFDLILSNPPYIPASDLPGLPPEYAHEPRVALASGDDGLDLPARIVAGAVARLTPAGYLAVEVGGAAALLEARFPRVPFFWPEFMHGGDGIALASAADLSQGLRA